MNETPFAVNMKRTYPVGTRVRLYDGRCGVVTQPPRDVWQHFGATVHYTYLGVEVAVQPDGKSYDIWFGINQIQIEGE